MSKILDSKGASGWKKDSEFIYRDIFIRGSNVLDLMKHLTTSHKTKQSGKPVGWDVFLKVQSELKIPRSTVATNRINKV